jgi:hypothetical protein
MMRKRIQEAQKKLTFIPPKLNRAVLAFGRLIAPLYLRLALGLRMRKVEGIERLIDAYREFQEGKSKLILVFRHSHVHDAQVMFHLVNSILPKAARRSGKKLRRRPHIHFLYGRGVPLWAGRYLAWIFSRIGAIPVSHRQLDRVSIDMIRDFILSSEYPVALAPEGQVTYHNRYVYEIEPGFAQIALWAAQDLVRARESRKTRENRTPDSAATETTQGAGPAADRVVILPISQYYGYGDDSLRIFDEIIARIEGESEHSLLGELGEREQNPKESAPEKGNMRVGEIPSTEVLPEGAAQAGPESGAGPESEPGLDPAAEPGLEARRRRLKAAGRYVLDLLEEFYRRFYRIDLGKTSEADGGEEEHEASGTGFTRSRVERITDAVLRMQEERLGITAPYHGFTPRIFTVRQAGWRHVFRLDPQHREKRSELEKSTDDYVAAEADLFSRHLEVVDALSYLRPEYGTEYGDANMLVETTLNLYDVTLRLRGGDISDRPDIRPTYVSVTVGEPVPLSAAGGPAAASTSSAASSPSSAGSEPAGAAQSMRSRRNELTRRVLEQFTEHARRKP